MNSNDLKTLIAIYKYDRSTNAAGTPVERYLFYRKVYASMKVLNTLLETEPAPGKVSSMYVEFIVRHDPQIDYNCKIVEGSNSYYINFIEEITRGGFLKLRCYAYNDEHAGEISYGG